MQTTNAPQKRGILAIFENTGLMVAGAAAYSMSTLFSAQKPALLTRFVEQIGTSETMAGFIVAMPFIGIAFSSLLQNSLTTRFTVRQLAIVFGTLLVAGELLSAWLYASVHLVLLAQFVGGTAVGVLMGATSKIVATTRQPDEGFGFVDMVAVLLMSFMIAGVGNAVGWNGLTGGFLFGAVVCFVYVVLVACYRQPDIAHDDVTNEPAPLKISFQPISVVLMAVTFITCSGLGFTYMFTIAIDLGMQYASAGTFIGILTLASASVSMLGGWCSARFGPARPLAVAYIACAIGWYFATHTDSLIVFQIALVPAIFALQFNFPVLLALAGSLDDQGRWAAIASPIQTSGFAWAAVLAGLIVDRWSIPALGIATAIGLGVCFLLLMPATRHVTR